MNKTKKDLYWFLTSTNTGHMMGGLDAGQVFLEKEFDALGIDLQASLLKSTGSNTVSHRAKIKAEHVVFYAGKADPNYNKIYFSVDPVPQQQGFDLPNAIVKSFNNSVDQKIISSRYIIGEFKGYMTYRKEKLDQLKTPQQKKEFFQQESNNGEYTNKAFSNQKSREEIQKERLEKAKKDAEIAARKEAEEKAIKARESISIWRKGEFVSPDKVLQNQELLSPYFKKKAMPIHSLLKIKRGSEVIPSSYGNSKGFVSEFDMIPLMNMEGKMVNYQKITTEEDSKKILASGLEAKGVFNIIGSTLKGLEQHDSIHFCEGLSNSYYVHKITNEPSVFCLNAKNLELVVSQFREAYPNKRFTIAADNDAFKPHSGNAGMKSAITAGVENNADVTFPIFKDSKDTDWDDYYRKYGEKAAKSTYLSKNNTFFIRNSDPAKLNFIKEFSKVKYASHLEVWDEISDFLMPKGETTSPNVFKARYDLLSKTIPEHAFQEQDVRDKKKFYPTAGLNFGHVPFESIVFGEDDTIKKLDKNSKSFYEKNVLPYIEVHQKSLNNLCSGGKIYDANNLSNDESKKILSTPGFLPKGEGCIIVTKVEEVNQFRNNFFVDGISGNYDDNNIYEGRLLSPIRFEKGDKGNSIEIKGFFKTAVVSERHAEAKNGDEELKDIMETKRSKKVLLDFNIEEIKVDGRKIKVESFRFDENSLKLIKDTIFSKSENPNLEINRTKDPDAWNISSIRVLRNNGLNQEKKVKPTINPSI